MSHPHIPGRALEIRYRRSTDGRRYVHRFRSPVKMRANATGSVTLYGRSRIHASDREPGFSRYVNPPRARARTARRERGGIGWGVLLAGGAVLWWLSSSTPRPVTPAAAGADRPWWQGLTSGLAPLVTTGASAIGQGIADWLRSPGPIIEEGNPEEWAWWATEEPIIEEGNPEEWAWW